VIKLSYLTPNQAQAKLTRRLDLACLLGSLAVPKAAIVAPLEGSEAATIATTEAAVSEHDDEDKDEEIDAHLQDNFKGID
jgi:hypothetical protein